MVSVQCMGNSGCFPWAESEQPYPDPPPPPPPCVQCFRVSIPPAVRPTLLRQMDMGSLTCAQIWVRAVHTKGGQAQTSLRKSWLGGTQKNLFLRGIELRVFGFEFQLSNHPATSPPLSETRDCCRNWPATGLNCCPGWSQSFCCFRSWSATTRVSNCRTWLMQYIEVLQGMHILEQGVIPPRSCKLVWLRGRNVHVLDSLKMVAYIRRVLLYL